MNEIKHPSLTEFRNAGYPVEISHKRAYKVAFVDYGGKIVTKIVNKTRREMNDGYRPNLIKDVPVVDLISELLPKGGKTTVVVVDPESGVEFYAESTCRDDENYDKNVGVNKCLERIVELIRVCAYNNEAEIPRLTEFIR